MHKRILKRPKAGEGALSARPAHYPRLARTGRGLRALVTQLQIDARIGTSKATQRHVLTVFDTGAGPNLIRSSMLPPEAFVAMDTERRIAQLYSATNHRLDAQ